MVPFPGQPSKSEAKCLQLESKRNDEITFWDALVSRI